MMWACPHWHTFVKASSVQATDRTVTARTTSQAKSPAEYRSTSIHIKDSSKPPTRPAACACHHTAGCQCYQTDQLIASTK